MRNKRLWLGLIAVGAVFAASFAYFAWPRPIAGPPPLPSPNGYDDLVAAGEIVIGQPPDSRTASPDQLRQFVGSNRAALDRARIGLSHECGVPVEHSQAHLEVGLERMEKTRAVVRVFSAAGKLAADEGRVADGAKSYLDLIRLGQELARGGLVLDRQLGTAVERDGIGGLQNLRVKLAGATRQDVMSALQQIEERAEPIEAVFSRERDFQDALIAKMGVAGILNGNKLRQLGRSAEPRTKEAATAVRQAARLLLIELAIQSHIEENGSPPAGLEDLVPRYLSAVPCNPEDGRPFEYTLDPSGFYGLGSGAEVEKGEAAKPQAR